MKVVINTTVGGYRLSSSALIEYCTKKKIKYSLDTSKTGHYEPDVVVYVDGVRFCHWDIPRHDPILIEVIEALGVQSAGPWSSLKIVDIPDGVDYIIVEHETGSEHIAEKHRTWG